LIDIAYSLISNEAEHSLVLEGPALDLYFGISQRLFIYRNNDNWWSLKTRFLDA